MTDYNWAAVETIGQALCNEKKAVTGVDLTKLSNNTLKLWANPSPGVYYPVSQTVTKIPAGLYDIWFSGGQVIFKAVDFSAAGLIRFDDSNIDEVVSEIQNFWTKKKLFNELNFPFKRGILLYGPPGGGKSCAIKLIVSDVIKQGGIAIRFSDVGFFNAGMIALREIHPDLPVVAIMEDLESFMAGINISMILNLLDGVSGFENIVYLATTNYPEDLEGRVKNRPSRFDRRYHIDFPSIKTRQTYLQSLWNECKSDELKQVLEKHSLKKWVDETEGFTFAHIKELFVSVFLFDHPYNDALKRLRDMKKQISSNDFDTKPSAGFSQTRHTF